MVQQASKQEPCHSTGLSGLVCIVNGLHCPPGDPEHNFPKSNLGTYFSCAAVLLISLIDRISCHSQFFLPAEQFVEKSSCAQPLGELTSLDAHGEFGGSGAGSSSPSSSSLCTEPLIPTTPIIPSEEMAKIACSLETKELWDKFHELGTEMIITKSGR